MTSSLTSQVLDQHYPRGPYTMMSQDMTYCWRNILNVVTSVTWRHRWRHQWTALGHFPIQVPNGKKIRHLQQFSRYLAWNIMNSWRHHWHHVTWINYPCAPFLRTMQLMIILKYGLIP